MAKHIGVLAGAFNPVTRAHLALAEAAAKLVDEVVCVVPRVYPHKHFHGAAMEDRIEMLKRAGGPYRVEITEGGLFIEIARELRQPHTEISFHLRKRCGGADHSLGLRRSRRDREDAGGVFPSGGGTRRNL